MTTPTQQAPAPEGVTSFNPCSDVGNGQRIARYFERDIRFIEGAGWYTWCGGPWRPDGARAGVSARGYVHTLGAWIAHDEVPELAGWVSDARDDKDECARRQRVLVERIKWANKTEQSQRIDAALKEAAVYLRHGAEEMDADPTLLGCPNGVVELETGRFRPHRRPDMITKTTGCEFDSRAKCPRWEQFVREVFADDDGVVEWVQRLLGYCLSGRRDLHILPVCWGNGSNGKSTMFDTVADVLGDYAGPAAPGLLMQHYHSDHPTGLADLQGKRLVVSNESGEGGRLNEELIKSLTGGDKIKARKMHQDFYHFSPTHQLFLLTNHKPAVHGGDFGIWRRLRLLPFTVRFDGEEKDPALKRKLATELPGILNWCLAGYRAYVARGLDDAPAAVVAATSEYRDAEDVVRRFVDECCTTDPALSARAGELYAGYRAWAEMAGEHPMSQRKFGERLAQAGFRKERSGGIVYRGLALRDGG